MSTLQAAPGLMQALCTAYPGKLRLSLRVLILHPSSPCLLPSTLQAAPGLMLALCTAYPREAALVAPLLEVLILVARYNKGAASLSQGNALVQACKELLVGMMVSVCD